MIINNKSKYTPNASMEPNSYYHETANRDFLTSICTEIDDCIDFAIIGGGFTGIGAALTLAKNGQSVVLFEANKIGQGASGRNGGLVCSGFRHDQKWFESKIGFDGAKKMWEISQIAKTHLQSLLDDYSIKADFEKGLVFAAHNKRMLDWLYDDAAHLANQYEYDEIDALDLSQTQSALSTNAYCGAIIDKGAGRIHPLKLLYGMTRAAIDEGAKITEHCPITKIQEHQGFIVLKTASREFKAKKLLICGDGYLHGIEPKIEAKVMPIGSFVIATEQLDEGLLKDCVGAMDTKFVVNYFQRTADNRLLFGGGEKYTPNWPENITQFVKTNLLKIYPQLENAKIDFAWGGALGITPTRLPYIDKVSANIYTAGGYSGQGVLLAPFFGDILARAVLGEAEKFEFLSRLPVPDFPGGRILRFPLLTAAMTYYSILDKLP